MAKFVAFFGLALVCVAGVSGGEPAKIRSRKEFMQKLDALGPAEPDQVQKLLEQVDLDAEVEIYYMLADNLLHLSTIKRENCDYHRLSYRFQTCKNLEFAEEDPHSNMAHYCLDRAQKQFDFCQSRLGELFSETLADLEESDKKLAIEFKQLADQDNHSGELIDQVEAAHRKLLGTYAESQVERSCKNVSSKLRLIEMLADEEDKSVNKELSNWLRMRAMCSIYLNLFSPNAIDWQRQNGQENKEH